MVQIDREDWMMDRREALGARIETGFQQAARGELIDCDTALEMLRQRRGEGLKPEG